MQKVINRRGLAKRGLAQHGLAQRCLVIGGALVLALAATACSARCRGDGAADEDRRVVTDPFPVRLPHLDGRAHDDRRAADPGAGAADDGGPGARRRPAARDGQAHSHRRARTAGGHRPRAGRHRPEGARLPVAPASDRVVHGRRLRPLRHQDHRRGARLPGQARLPRDRSGRRADLRQGHRDDAASHRRRARQRQAEAAQAARAPGRPQAGRDLVGQSTRGA